MNSEITFTFGQLIGFLFAILGMVAIVVFIILLVRLIKLVKEYEAVGRDVRETMDYTREKVDNIFGVVGTIGDVFGKIKTGLDLTARVEQFTSKLKRNKNKKQGEG